MSWRRALTAVTVVCAMVLSGCVGLPTDTDPQALRSFEASSQVEEDLGPEEGQQPDLLLRDFYRASASPTANHSQARAYLTPPAAERWDSGTSTLIVDRLDITTQAGATSQERTFDIRGNVIGTLRDGGSYIPENGAYEATVEMELVDGEWRVSSLPSGVVMERTDLRNNYEPHNLYFFDTTERVLVADRRWIFAGEKRLDTVLISMLVQGPSERVAPAVSTILPAQAEFIGESDGVYRFSGLEEADVQTRGQFAAQLTWTLALANVPTPYTYETGGLPLIESRPQLVPDDFAELNPRVGTTAASPLYALTDGRIYEISSNQAIPVDGPLGAAGNLESADLTAEGTAAAVREDGDTSTLVITAGEGGVEEVLTANTISRPSFEFDPNAAWVVLNGEDVVRVVRSESTDEVAQLPVDTSALEDLDGEISMLRLSRSASYAAMLIDGRVYVGVVSRPSAGSRAIVNVQEIDAELSGTALAVDWQPDGSLLVGTSALDTPVWRVEQDGSSVAALSSSNITAPVVSVAASPNTMYATDARAALQLPAGGSENVIWREVPGLQGVRSVAIVAN